MPPVNVVGVVKFVIVLDTISELPLLAWNVPLLVTGPAVVDRQGVALVGEDCARRPVDQRHVAVVPDHTGALDRVIHVGQGRSGVDEVVVELIGQRDGAAAGQGDVAAECDDRVAAGRIQRNVALVGDRALQREGRAIRTVAVLPVLMSRHSACCFRLSMAPPLAVVSVPPLTMPLARFTMEPPPVERMVPPVLLTVAGTRACRRRWPRAVPALVTATAGLIVRLLVTLALIVPLLLTVRV